MRFIIYLIGIIMLMNFSTAALNDNITAYFDMEESVSTFYDGAGVKNGSQIGTIYKQGPGIIDYGVAMTGIGGINTTRPFTPQASAISLWFKTNYTAGYQGIIGSTESAINGGFYIILRGDTTNQLHFYVRDGGTNTIDNANYSEIIDLTNESWYFLVINFDGTDGWEMWINGDNLTLTDSTGTMSDSTHHLTLGSVHTLTDFQGEMDEFGWWNRTLTQAEISELYNSGNGLNPLGFTQTITSPTNNTDIFLNRSTNYTIDIGSPEADLVNVSFYFNNTLIETKTITGKANITTFDYKNTLSGLKEWYFITCNINQCENSEIRTNNYQNLKINLLHGDNTTVTGGQISIPELGIINQTTPYYADYSTILGENDNATYYVEGDDLELYGASVNVSTIFYSNQVEYNITLNDKGLRLNYYLYNGTAHSVYGFFQDQVNPIENFTNVNFTKILRDAAQGYVTVRWGYNETVSQNHTQFYEYYNDWITDTEENMTMLELADIVHYVKVQDENGNEIDEVLVKAMMAKPEQGGEWVNIGQRFTGNMEGRLGMTYFYLDTDSQVIFQFSKDGYEVDQKNFDPNTDSRTKDDPYTVTLRKSDITTRNNIEITIPPRYDNNTATMGITVYAPSRNSATYTTSYRIAQGYGNDSIPLNIFKYGEKELTDGQDFDSNSGVDLTVYIYIDGSLHSTYTIENRWLETGKFNEPSNTNETWKELLLWITIIIGSGVTGLMFKRMSDDEEGSGEFGKTIFFGSIILTSIIFGLIFSSVFYIASLWILLRVLRGWISE